MMTAELGQTSDPTALIPGDPDAVHNAEWSMTIYGDMLHEAGAGLQRIDTTQGWRGEASDRFRKVFHGQPYRWLKAGDAFHTAAKALDSYAATLTWAQRQAADAVNLWNQGRAATGQAWAQHAQAVQQAQQEAAASTVAGIPTTAPDIPFVDPGEAKRQAACSILDRARSQLRSAGDTATGVVGKARDQAPKKPGFWSHVGHFFGGLGHDLEDTGAHVVNGLASFGNAAVHHPGGLLAAAGGIGLTAVSAAGEGVGTVLDATGVGAVAGVPLNAVSAAGMAAGVGITSAAMANMVGHAADDDHVSPMNTGDSADSGGGETTEGNNPPKEITGLTEHGDQQAQSRDGGRGVADEAMNDAVQNPIRPPQPQLGGTYKYVGKNATVVLNSDGEVVTTWARNSGGWRNP